MSTWGLNRASPTRTPPRGCSPVLSARRIAGVMRSTCCPESSSVMVVVSEYSVEPNRPPSEPLAAYGTR